jgi:hypothetical protein
MAVETAAHWWDIVGALATAAAAIVALALGVVGGIYRRSDNQKRDTIQRDADANQARQITLEYVATSITNIPDQYRVTNHSESPIHLLTCWTARRAHTDLSRALVASLPMLAPKASWDLPPFTGDDGRAYGGDALVMLTDARGLRWYVEPGAQPVQIDKNGSEI